MTLWKRYVFEVNVIRNPLFIIVSVHMLATTTVITVYTTFLYVYRKHDFGG